MRKSKILRNVSLGIRSLVLHKLRSLLTMLGVVFGVGSVIAMLAVGEGASQEALEQIRKLGANNIIIDSVKPVGEDSSGAERVRMSMFGLLYDDALRLSESMPMIERTAPVKVVRKTGRFRTRSMELRVVGTTETWFDLVDRPLVAGRALVSEDIETVGNVVVLTEHGARKILATEAALGEDLQIGDQYFEVVGIVRNAETSAGSIKTPDRQIDAYIPLSVAIERFGDMFVQRSAGSMTRELVELHQIIVSVEDTENVEPAAMAIRSMLERFHKKNDYTISVPLALLKQAEATKRTFSIVLGSIAGISLLVGGIGIMNIMLASVTERTREIGIRRAIGAKRRQIVGQFLIETIVLSTAGGIVGVCLGIFLPWLISNLAGMPTVVPLYSIVLSLGISMGVGIIFGLYPAVRAARLDPIVALRHE
ncbi:MAG: ABC transporter permease [Verrucomicrobiota bacterium]